jgi:hypothetical protein
MSYARHVSKILLVYQNRIVIFGGGEGGVRMTRLVRTAGVAISSARTSNAARPGLEAIMLSYTARGACLCVASTLVHGFAVSEGVLLTP